MGTTAEKTAPRRPKTNRIGLTVDAYQGAASTLCKGCGHDRITSSIINALFELGIEPHRVAKLSGIGCSSKSTNYFLNNSHGFNTLHGRMAAISTGAALANRDMLNIGVSGDGDTASIGIGHFVHMVRRNVPMVYIIENNGCYGLTKGQFSATADKGSVKKGGDINEMPSIDCCSLAIELGCGFVARSFSADGKQVTTLLKAAMSHNGTAVVDILSPCVTFNNHEGSTKSLSYARDNKDPLHDLDFIPHYEDITVEMEAGDMQDVELHDGSRITVKKLEHEYDPSNRAQAASLLERARRDLLFYTGLLYHNGDNGSIQDHLDLVDEPLSGLQEDVTRPSKAVFDEIMESFR
jgi:2-oxoglutarate ferredoxin oxidoreductase subunit beta